MEIKLSKLRRVTLYRMKPEFRLYQFNGWDYWFIRIPFTKIVIHYQKLPF